MSPRAALVGMVHDRGELVLVRRSAAKYDEETALDRGRQRDLGGARVAAGRLDRT